MSLCVVCYTIAMSDGFLSPQLHIETPSVPEAVPAVAEDVSSVAADEKALEEISEQPDRFLETEEATQGEAGVSTEQAGEQAAGSGSAAVTPAVVGVAKDEVLVEVERILEDGLGNYFNGLPEQAQTRFKKKGEEVAFQIAVMVRGFKVRARKVLQMIHDWLLTIPGVNKFFLEQESKIKTDRILALQESFRAEPPHP